MILLGARLVTAGVSLPCSLLVVVRRASVYLIDFVAVLLYLPASHIISVLVLLGFPLLGLICSISQRMEIENGV